MPSRNLQFALRPFLTLGLLLASLCLVGSLAAAEQPKYQHGVLIRFEGVITPGLERYLARKLAIAQDEGADLVILEIESPGGQLWASLRIAEQMRDLRWAHTVAYIPDKALSGAAIAALGCDEILMAPDARIGDAGAIVLGDDSMFRFAPQKIVSDLAVQMRNLAKAKGRPPALAEAMVDRTLSVYRVRNVKTGAVGYLSEREIDEDPDAWKKLGTVQGSGNDRFLDVTGSHAVEMGLAQGLVADRKQVAERYALDALDVLQPSGTDTTIDILNSWWITGLLLVLGLVGLYLEFTMPGTAVGGLLGAAAFALLFWSHFLGGTAGWLEAVLFLLGVVFMAVELFVVPGSILAGLVGVILILVSLIMVTQGFLVPETRGQVQELAGTLLMIFVSGVVSTIAAVFISRHFVTLPLFNRLTLAPPDASSDRPGGGGIAGQGPSVRLGDIGTAHSPLRPGGRAQFGDRYVDVLTDGDFIDRGRRVRVVRVQGSQVVVAEVEAGET